MRAWSIGRCWDSSVGAAKRTPPTASRDDARAATLEISAHTFRGMRHQYGGGKADDAKDLRGLRDENASLDACLQFHHDGTVTLGFGDAQTAEQSTLDFRTRTDEHGG